MASQWHSCPQDILERGFRAQPNYSDNAAAACACKLWREAFISASLSSRLVYGGVRTEPSSEYLRHHTNLTSLTVVSLPPWQSAQLRLHAASGTVPYHSFALSTWSQVMSALPASCRQLTLDHFLPDFHPGTLFDGVLDQVFCKLDLQSLRHLTLKEDSGNRIALEALSGLLSLQILEVSGKRGKRVQLTGMLITLPPNIHRLQLHRCEAADGVPLQLEHLQHLRSLQDLYLYAVDMRFGLAAQSVLSLLTRLVLCYFPERVSLEKHIPPLSRLQSLRLKQCMTLIDLPIPLACLLRHLSCLQELDIQGSSTIDITPADCRHLQLRTFSFDADMLTNIDESLFEHFMLRGQTPGLVNKPSLRMRGSFPRFTGQDWVVLKPFYALTQLTISATAWPAIFACDEIDLPLLQVLDFRFALPLIWSSENWHADESAVILGPQLNLAELYIAGSSNVSFDLARCTSLRSVGITYKAPVKPVLSLPPFLMTLCLHNMLSASCDLHLDELQDLVSIKLGGRAADADATRQLPSLPQSLAELDLWDGLLTDLQQLSRLTNLQRLVMPDAPTEQQLQSIRQLRHLRHVEVPRRKGTCVAIAM